MSYWLIKSDPETYSLDNLEKDKITIWDGVRNAQARNYLKQMKFGDTLFFYHSGDDKSIVGLAEVVEEFFQDPTTDDNRWVAVKVKFQKKFKNPLSLAVIKNTVGLENIQLLKQSRLSVMPITDKEAKTILSLTK
ncbi:MAG: EVE domain-containing protein [Candidatus Kapabacteria bacterium]|nr:EVE domain-containing protein [Candidatus Kapabacteria bacterium]